MSLGKIRGAKAVMPEVSLFEAQSTLEGVTARNGKYIVLAVVTHGDIFPYLEGMLEDASSKVEDGPEYIKPITEKHSVQLPDIDRYQEVYLAFYQTNSSIVDLLLETRPDDNWTGLFKTGSWPTMEVAKKCLLSDAEKYVKSYLPDRIFVPDSVSEDFFYEEREAEAPSEEQVAAAERDENVDALLEGFYDKMMTATGMENSLVDDLSEMYAEFQQKYGLLENAEMDDIKRMAIRRSHTLSARRKLSDLVLESPLQLTRFLALYDDRRTSPESACFYSALEKGMDDLLGFETAIIDQGELSQKKRETGMEVAASLLEDWKGREKALVRYETSRPGNAIERMEALSEAVDKISRLGHMFEQAGAIVDARLKKRKAEEEQKKAPGGNPLGDINKGSKSPFGRLPPSSP